MNASELVRLFGFDNYTVTKNVEGFTHEESLAAPANGGNCANWILGHVIESRSRMLAMIGAGPFWDRGAPYAQGAGPVDGGSALPFNDLVAAYGAVHERTVEFVGAMSDADLARPFPEETRLGNTYAEVIASFSWHEGYHSGQLGLLRRTAGRAGQMG